jgi:hypothetical protein
MAPLVGGELVCCLLSRPVSAADTALICMHASSPAAALKSDLGCFLRWINRRSASMPWMGSVTGTELSYPAIHHTGLTWAGTPTWARSQVVEPEHWLRPVSSRVNVSECRTRRDAYGHSSPTLPRRPSKCPRAHAGWKLIGISLPRLR